MQKPFFQSYFWALERLLSTSFWVEKWAIVVKWQMMSIFVGFHFVKFKRWEGKKKVARRVFFPRSSRPLRYFLPKVVSFIMSSIKNLSGPPQKTRYPGSFHEMYWKELRLKMASFFFLPREISFITIKFTFWTLNCQFCGPSYCLIRDVPVIKTDPPANGFWGPKSGNLRAMISDTYCTTAHIKNFHFSLFLIE